MRSGQRTDYKTKEERRVEKHEGTKHNAFFKREGRKAGKHHEKRDMLREQLEGVNDADRVLKR